MCGIVGFVGPRKAWPILYNGLKRLEYRGYDSAGVAYQCIDIPDSFRLFKTVGKVSGLEELFREQNPENQAADQQESWEIGIGHSRWATHGAPTFNNAHPHTSQSGRLVLVHNGIIENYAVIKQELLAHDFEFKSDTDTEVLVQWIEYILLNDDVPLLEAVRLALSQVVGAYAIVVLDRENPDSMVVARKGSPLVIGLGQEYGEGKREYFVASDASPFVEYTREVVYLHDEEIAEISANGIRLITVENQVKTPFVQLVELRLEEIERGGYPCFMIKEIFEQPRSVKDCLRGRIDLSEGKIVLGGLKDFEGALKEATRLIIVGCGTSWHAGLVGEYLIEEYARLSVSVEYASEFRYRNPIIEPGDFVLAISQSGETADTLAALQLAKEKGAIILGVCNVVGSSIPRLTHAGVYTHAGPEIGVASTKAFTAQVSVLSLIALYLGQIRGTLDRSQVVELSQALEKIPELVEQVLKCDDIVAEIAHDLVEAKNALYLGRGLAFPVALEGALKLKEISYIHAEGYPAAEMKHGPIALLDEEMPVIVIATEHGHYDKIVSNIQEVKARNAKIVAIVTQGDQVVRNLADYTIEIPQSHEIALPILASIPLQLLSYHIATLRGCNVDQPRNLAKSVTVE